MTDLPDASRYVKPSPAESTHEQELAKRRESVFSQIRADMEGGSSQSYLYVGNDIVGNQIAQELRDKGYRLDFDTIRDWRYKNSIRGYTGKCFVTPRDLEAEKIKREKDKLLEKSRREYEDKEKRKIYLKALAEDQKKALEIKRAEESWQALQNRQQRNVTIFFVGSAILALVMALLGYEP